MLLKHMVEWLKLSSEIEVSRESFYRSLSQKGKAKFTTLINAINACGVEIDFHPRSI